MIRPTPDDLVSLASTAKQQRRFVDFLQRCRDDELESLPKQMVNVAVMQGRCQILQELCKLLNESSAMEATMRQPTKI